MRTLDLDQLTLTAGVHVDHDGMCVMEAVSYVAGEPWTDSPQCVSEVISTFLRKWNDDMECDDRQMLKQLIPVVIGTAGSDAEENRRRQMISTWLFRSYVPEWMKLIGEHDHAEILRTCEESELQLRLAAAWSAAWAAARSAAWAAAGSAAGSAAWDAAVASAGYAAVAAALDAALSDARDAAMAAARSAARDAALDSALSAARSAAVYAAVAILRPTVVRIQQSALQLVRDMSFKT